jgi:hypothetical protein
MVFFGLCFLPKHTFLAYSHLYSFCRAFRQAAFLTAFSESVNYLQTNSQTKQISK